MRVQTQSIHFDADAKLLDLIETRLQKLESFYDQIIDANVFLRLENTGQVQDKIVEVTLKVPREQLVAKGRDKKFEVALDEVIEALRRQIIKYKGKLKAHS